MYTVIITIIVICIGTVVLKSEGNRLSSVKIKKLTNNFENLCRLKQK